jgi:hypothetical protein
VLLVVVLLLGRGGSGRGRFDLIPTGTEAVLADADPRNDAIANVFEGELDVAAGGDAVAVEGGLEDVFDGEAFVVDELQKSICGARLDRIGKWIKVQDWIDDCSFLCDRVNNDVGRRARNTGWEGVNHWLGHGLWVHRAREQVLGVGISHDEVERRGVSVLMFDRAKEAVKGVYISGWSRNGDMERRGGLDRSWIGESR